LGGGCGFTLDIWLNFFPPSVFKGGFELPFDPIIGVGIVVGAIVLVGGKNLGDAFNDFL